MNKIEQQLLEEKLGGIMVELGGSGVFLTSLQSLGMLHNVSLI